MRFSFEGSSSNVLHFKLLEVFYHLQTQLSGVGEKKKVLLPPPSVPPSFVSISLFRVLKDILNHV